MNKDHPAALLAAATEAAKRFHAHVVLKGACIFAADLMRRITIPFTIDFLHTFSRLEPTPLEIRESVDMMRAIEHGYKVKMVPCEAIGVSVDTEADRRDAEKIMKQDSLFLGIFG